MSPFIKKIFFFVVACILFAIISNQIVSVCNNAPLHYRLHYKKVFDTTTNYDGIIIGSSHALHSIRPTILKKHTNISFYNYALNGAGPKFFNYWFKNLYNKYHSKPKFCILQVDYFIFDEVILNRTFEQDAEYFPIDVFFQNLINYPELKMKYNTPQN